MNVRSFLKHMKSSPPAQSRLPERSINSLIKFLDDLVKSLKKPITQRRHKVKSAKAKLVHSRQDMQTCLMSCRTRIPEVLGEFGFEFERILIITGET